MLSNVSQRQIKKVLRKKQEERHMIEEEVSSVRETSRAAFHSICESGVLSRARLQTYKNLYEFGPCTASELFYHSNRGRNPSHSNITTRLGELRDMECVSEVGKRKCSVTGETVLVWAVNGNHPKKLEKTDTYKLKTKRLIALLNWIVAKYPHLKEEIVAKNEELKVSEP
jgi:hypothetical protein